jgi:hypothetical protein
MPFTATAGRCSSRGKPVITLPTEAEARAAAERHGWTIDEDDRERSVLG